MIIQFSLIVTLALVLLAAFGAGIFIVIGGLVICIEGNKIATDKGPVKQ